MVSFTICLENVGSNLRPWSFIEHAYLNSINYILFDLRKLI